MATVTFILKKPTSKEETPLFLVFRYKEERVKIAIYDRIHPEFWDKTKQRAKSSKKFPEYPEFNSRLDDIESRAKNVFRRFEIDHKTQPSPTQLRILLDKEFNNEPVEVEKKDLFSFIPKFIEESKNKINDKTEKPFADCTVNIYKNTFRLLNEFKDKKKIKIDFDNICLKYTA